jgi:hypothetical protein
MITPAGIAALVETGGGAQQCQAEEDIIIILCASTNAVGLVVEH